MRAPEHMLPINPNLLDTLVKGGESGWIPNDAEGLAFIKVLFVGEESGQWAVLFRWKKGYVAGPHKHLQRGDDSGARGGESNQSWGAKLWHRY